MPTFTASNKSSKVQDGGERGFTLVELMVVIFVVGLMAGAVVLTMDTRDRTVETAAERFAARIAAARDMAVIEARPIRLWVSRSGYGFDQYRQGQWQSGQDNLEAQDWPRGTAVATDSGSQARRLIDPSGLPDAGLSVTLGDAGSSVTVVLEGSGEVRVDGQ